MFGRSIRTPLRNDPAALAAAPEGEGFGLVPRVCYQLLHRLLGEFILWFGFKMLIEIQDALFVVAGMLSVAAGVPPRVAQLPLCFSLLTVYYGVRKILLAPPTVANFLCFDLANMPRDG